MTHIIRVATLVVMVPLMVATAVAQSAPPPPATSEPPKLEVSGPTYFADGEIRGASARWALTLKQPIEMYQTSGKTLCESASAVTSKPTDAGSGWRLTIVPLHLGRELVLSVNWQRLWERGETLTSGPKGSAVVRLQAGERILLDYITAGELSPTQNVVWRPGARDEPVVRFSTGCGAIGMGLQIGLPAAESETFVETSLWLVRTLADGRERVRQQTVRSRTGTVAEFVFDDETIMLTAPKPTRAGQTAERIVRTSGRLRQIGIDGSGKVIMELTLAQRLVAPPASSADSSGGTAAQRLAVARQRLADMFARGYKPEHPDVKFLEGTIKKLQVEADEEVRRGGGGMNGGSATFELTAGPDEVVAFRVPQVVDDTGRVGERMSLRVQMKVLNR